MNLSQHCFHKTRTNTIMVSLLIAPIMLVINLLPFSTQFIDQHIQNTQAEGPEQDYWLGEFTRLEAMYRMTWYNNFVRFEETSLPQGDGALIGWIDGSYALPAYLDMYEWNGDKTYLERFIERSRQLLTYQWDANGDGLVGWPTSRYSTNYVANSRFEESGLNWIGIDADINLIKNADGDPVHLFRVWGPGCSMVIPGVNNGAYHLQLRSEESVSQVLSALPIRAKFNLRMNAKIPPDMHLNIRLKQAHDGYEDRVLDRNATRDELRGPQDWQLFSSVVEIIPGSIVTLTLGAYSDSSISTAILIDNVVLSPFEEYLAEEFALAGNLARFAVIVEKNPNLTQYSSIAEQFATQAADIAEKWQPYWRWIDQTQGVYVAPYDDSLPAFRGRTLPYNMMSLAGSAQAWLGQLPYMNDAPKYQSQAKALANTLHSALRPNPDRPDALLWNYNDSLLPTDPAPNDPPSPNVEDISHAGPSASFMGQMRRLGEVFTDEDIAGVAETLAHVVWNQSETMPVFLRHLDGRDGPISPRLGMPYYRHLDLVGSPDLQQAVTFAWQNAQTYLACHVQERTSLTGRNLSVPALMLLRTESDHWTFFLPLVEQ